MEGGWRRKRRENERGGNKKEWWQDNFTPSWLLVFRDRLFKVWQEIQRRAERSRGRLLDEAAAVASVHQFIFVFTCLSGDIAAEGWWCVRLRQVCVSSERTDVFQSRQSLFSSMNFDLTASTSSWWLNSIIPVFSYFFLQDTFRFFSLRFCVWKCYFNRGRQIDRLVEVRSRSMRSCTQLSRFSEPNRENLHHAIKKTRAGKTQHTSPVSFVNLDS